MNWTKVETGKYVSGKLELTYLANGPYSGLWCLSTGDEYSNDFHVFMRGSKEQCQEMASTL